MGFVGLVPSCHHVFVAPKIFLARKLKREFFFRGYFVGPKHFIQGASWDQEFSRGYFVGRIFFLVDISWLTRKHIKEEQD